MKIIREKYIERIDKWWHANNKDALLVLGVKNVGKSFLIRSWAKENGIPHTYFEPKKYDLVKDIFEDSKSKNFDVSIAIINQLLMSQPLNELLIFDGIKPKDEILVQIKKLCSTSKHRYILISDYGEYVFDSIRFIPVGSMNKLIVRPLSFKEYCALKLNKYVISSLKTAITEENEKLPFSDQFEEAWTEYSKFGGFPNVVSRLLEEGMPFAEAELINIKFDLLHFVNDNIPYSNNSMLLLDNFGNSRSKTYHRYVFSSLPGNGTYQRYKRALSILERLGIIGVLPIEGESLYFDYCDMYLCDPGLERIWGEGVQRHHVVESIVYYFGIRKNYRVRRLVLDKDKIIDLAYDTMIPWLMDIKLRNTNLACFSELKFKGYIGKTPNTFKPYVLIDKGIASYRKGDKATTLPVWAFLMME